MMRWKSFRFVALAGVAVVTLLFVVLRPLAHKLVVKAYFTNAGLRAGASVRLAGVDVGSVRTVRARPELKETPVEIVMVLNPQYDLNIPADSTVLLETAGVLGETFVEVDSAHASGPPIRANSVLKAQPTARLTTEQIMEKLSGILGKKTCDCETKNDDTVRTAAEKKVPSKNPSH
jgi:ABC-type transporter Mla subunit MlaD